MTFRVDRPSWRLLDMAHERYGSVDKALVSTGRVGKSIGRVKYLPMNMARQHCSPLI